MRTERRAQGVAGRRGELCTEARKGGGFAGLLSQQGSAWADVHPVLFCFPSFTLMIHTLHGYIPVTVTDHDRGAIPQS